MVRTTQAGRTLGIALSLSASSLLCGVLLALARVVPTYVWSAEYSLEDGWVLGVIPTAALFGACAGVLFSPLVFWALSRLPAQRAAGLGLALFAGLAVYMVASTAVLLRTQHEDIGGIWTFFVPAVLAASGLVLIRRSIDA